MGNEELKEKQEFVTFEVIQEALGLNNPVLFKNYLKEVFNDLGNSVNKQNKKFMTRMVFYDYIKLPIFIAEKLFKSFMKSSKQGLCEEEFVENFFKLYMGSFEETTTIIFNLLDFDKDGIIKKEDVKIILSYLPLNDTNEEKNEQNEKKENTDKSELITKIFGTQMKSLEEIDDIVSDTFNKYNGKMNMKQFTEIVTEKNSEVFLQILCFLYEQIPFSAKNVEILKGKYNLINDDDYEFLSQSYRSNKKSNSIRIKTPRRSSLLSPAGIFLQKFQLRKFSLNEVQNNDDNVTPNKNKKISVDSTTKESESNMSINSSKSDSPNPKNAISMFDINSKKIISDPYNKNIDIVRLDNENYLENKNNILLNNENKNIKQIVEISRNRYTSPTKYLQDKSYLNHLAISKSLLNKDNKKLDNQLGPINESEDENENYKNDQNSLRQIMDNINNNINYENWVYKITESGRLRKFYLVLVNKDTYYYKNEKKTDFVGMHNLSGCFVQECNEKKVMEGKEYYSFEIYCKNKSKARKYFTNSESVCKEFVEKIKKAIGYVKFSDLYEMKEVIGKGKFGVVNLGIHKKTGQQVAIKILNKENIKTLEDKELVRIEIGILKLCHHPNIVKLLDHLENNDYIYIVTEYIEGGTLGQYFKKKKFNFSERQATNIMSQIASGVKYLHQYGIVHRDLKPDNIMITQQNEYGVIKIMDFGLSKIVSPNERMVDGYGTLSYVAPEVLLRTPYNKEVDIWSLGVILFYMLSGKLPYRGRKEQEVAEKIVYDPLEFDEDDWETRTQRVRDLIQCCLEKKSEDRITIEEFINHPWFKKNMKPKLSM
jgi:Ca2+-binding EF-hand superfamily protein